MNKTISSKSHIVICVFGFVFLFFMMILGVVLIINGVTKNDSIRITIAICMECFFLFALCFNFVCLNISALRVYYDADEGVITTKGLIFGCRQSIKVEDIEDIEIQFYHMQDHLFVIMEKDKNEKKIGKTIKLTKNTQNEVFIKQFWDKPFTDTRDSIWRLG